MKQGILVLVIFLYSSQAQINGQQELNKPELMPGMQTHQMIEGEMHLNYLLYLPDNYDPDKEDGFPCILFLHGAGERGDSLDAVTAWGPPRIVRGGKGLPFIIISPQCPKNEWWTSMLYPLKSLLDESINNYNIDTSRVYLTGLSMGGYGAFALSQVYPDYFAAVAPICGGGTPSMVNFSKQPPTWVFHGDQDTIVPIESSQIMVDALRASGCEVKFTIYEGVDHYSFGRAYNESDLFEWFLEHKKTGSMPHGIQ